MSKKGKRDRDRIELAIVEENDGSPRTRKMRDSITEFYSSRPDFLPTSISFFYFIGRLNPPHPGHIAALHRLITMAHSENSIPLILLGNGPQPKLCKSKSLDTQEKHLIEQTYTLLDNPIDFELKKRFIEYKLLTEYGIDPTTYLIVEKGSPSKQVSDYITCTLKQPGLAENIIKVDIYHVAGDKDEDTTKLDFIKPIAINTTRPLLPQVREILAKSIGIPAITIEGSGIELSATLVRLAGYNKFLNADYVIPKEYIDFYNGDDTETGQNFTEEIFGRFMVVASSVERAILESYIECKTPQGALGFKENFTRKGKRENKYRSRKKPKKQRSRQTKGPRQRHRRTKRR